jgi:hypothetical protein
LGKRRAEDANPGKGQFFMFSNTHPLGPTVSYATNGNFPEISAILFSQNVKQGSAGDCKKRKCLATGRTPSVLGKSDCLQLSLLVARMPVNGIGTV